LQATTTNGEISTGPNKLIAKQI